MPGRYRTLAVLVLVGASSALPLASSADDPAAALGSVRLKFAAPKGWTDDTRPTERAGIWRTWVVRDGGVVQSIVLSVTRESRTAGPYAQAAVAYLKTAANVNVMDFGPSTTCGDVPAYTYTYRSDRTPGHPMIIRHVLVDLGTLLGDVSYARPPDLPDRADALAALSTLCDDGVSATPGPAASQALAR